LCDFVTTVLVITINIVELSIVLIISIFVAIIIVRNSSITLPIPSLKEL
jgi:hypothetical protein